MGFVACVWLTRRQQVSSDATEAVQAAAMNSIPEQMHVLQRQEHITHPMPASSVRTCNAANPVHVRPTDEHSKQQTVGIVTRHNLSCTYLAHHELESVLIIIIIAIIIVIIYGPWRSPR